MSAMERAINGCVGRKRRVVETGHVSRAKPRQAEMWSYETFSLAYYGPVGPAHVWPKSAHARV